MEKENEKWRFRETERKRKDYTTRKRGICVLVFFLILYVLYCFFVFLPHILWMFKSCIRLIKINILLTYIKVINRWKGNFNWIMLKTCSNSVKDTSRRKWFFLTLLYSLEIRRLLVQINVSSGSRCTRKDAFDQWPETGTRVEV